VSEEQQVARRAGLVGSATLLSRVLGLAREQVMASWFGAGFATDAFNVAFRIPNLLRDLFAEGAMSSAFVPTFTQSQQTRGADEAWAFGRQLIVTLVGLLTVVCAIGALAAPWLVRVFAPGFERIPGKLELTVLLTQVMLPFLPLVAGAAACMGMLNANGNFAAPALAPAFMNFLMIAVGLALIPVCERLGQPPVLAMAIGVVVGGLGQFAWQLPPLWKLGFRLRWEMPRAHPGVRRVAFLMVPATIGLAATQFNLFFSTMIASLLPQGSVSWLWYAFRLMQLPIGVFGVALGTVSLPSLARAAVAGDMAALKTTLSATIRLGFLLTVPAAVWLAVSARPVIALLYQHGHFGVHDTVATAGALMAYCVGLPAFAAVGVFTRTFYALGDTKTPVRASFISVAINVVLNLLFMRPFGHVGLALATALTSIVNLTQLALALRKRVGPLEGRRMLRTVVRVGAASAVAGLACAAGLWFMPVPHGFVREALVVGALALAGGTLIYAMMKVLRVEEVAVIEDLARGMQRRVFGR
jgi:putative peptidoglycan lipid II flippase